MIEYSNDDILVAKTDYVVNPVNTVGVMGKGLAKQFAFSFPQMLYLYKEECKANRLYPGVIFVYKAEAYEIVNLPTKTDWRQASTYGYITKGLAALHKLLTANPEKSIAIPALGCGNGELKWDIVRRMMEDCLSALPNKIVIYPPRG